MRKLSFGDRNEGGDFVGMVSGIVLVNVVSRFVTLPLVAMITVAKTTRDRMGTIQTDSCLLEGAVHTVKCNTHQSRDGKNDR